MALIVGNLLTVPAATSFISLADAEAYLTHEGAGQVDTTPIGRWFVASSSVKEATLVRVSRWMAASLSWARTDLSEIDLLRVGHVAARLATNALSVDLYAAADAKGPIKRAKAGTVEVEYAGGMVEYQAGGKYWPWLTSQLAGLLVTPRSGIGILVI